MASLCGEVFITAFSDTKPLAHRNGFGLRMSAIFSFKGVSLDAKPLAMANGFAVWKGLYYSLF